MNKKLFCGLLLTLFSIAANHLLAEAISIKGANGRVVDFVGIRQANHEGMFMMISRQEGEIFVPWSVFDLTAMQSEHPHVYRIYQRLRTPNVEVVDINLGIYENMLTLPQMVEKAKRLSQRSLTLPVPPMTQFYDMSSFNGNYSGPLRNYYTTWQRRSEEFARNYERMLDDFFKLNSADARRETWELWSGVRDNVINTVIVDIHPPRHTVNFTIQHLLNECTDPNMRSRNLMVQYYRSHKEVYDAIMDFFNQLTNTFDANLVLGQTRDITVQRTSLDRARGHFAKMQDTAALDVANFHRDMARFFQEWDLVPEPEHARR
jgi:hypothetical protein